MADREPFDRWSRPTGEMPAEPSPRSATPHTTHDVVLLAAVGDRDPDPASRATVERMIADCHECAAIAEDLRLLAIGLADLPPSLPAPRDMRLTEADAARLRRGGVWRAILRPFGATGLPGLRPLAGALTALGLAGLLMTTIPLGLGGSAALTEIGKNFGAGGAYPAASAAPAVASSQSTNDSAGGPGEQSSPESPRAAETAAAPPASDNHGNAGASAAPTASDLRANGPESTAGGTGSSIPPVTVISIVLLGGGLGLLALRLLAGRLA